VVTVGAAAAVVVVKIVVVVVVVVVGSCSLEELLISEWVLTIFKLSDITSKFQIPSSVVH
jgi:hypothetical protein